MVDMAQAIIVRIAIPAITVRAAVIAATVVILLSIYYL